ncbi:hypothetical protein FQA39_LY05202 [Lamprigera yunnana]|nr:hypothetical protein FQA39_LY05202 [Lamprigera yunnana]
MFSGNINIGSKSRYTEFGLGGWEKPEIIFPDQPSTSAIQKLKWKKQNDKISQIESSDTSDNDQANTIEYAESDDSPWDPSMSDDNLNTEAECSTVEKLPTKKTVGTYVAVIYNKKYYPGQITKFEDNGAIVNVMTQYGKQWKWPSQKDEIFYNEEEIVMTLKTSTRRGHRELFDIPELTNI